MKVLLHGKNASRLSRLIQNLGFEIIKENPDAIISYGGDGTLFTSERLYPGIPKLPIRDSLVCQKCPRHDEEVLLKRLANGSLKFKEFKKLTTTIFYKDFYALNDFVIRNSSPIHTIRFQINPTSQVVRIQPARLNKLLIGDGIVVSTPFGSTGYFKSITGKIFTKGFGVAFNNTTAKIASVFLKDHETFTFQLVRGKATLSFDNNPEIFNVDEGSEITFKLSDKVARIYRDTSLRCVRCQIKR